MMNLYIKIIFFCCVVIMRVCSKAIAREAQKSEYCWLENAITDLEKIIKEKL